MSHLSRLRTALTLLARLLLGVIFALSAVSKITAPGAFRADVAAYHLLPPGLVGPFATALPWIEALVALYLLVGLFLRATAVATAVLLVMFSGALVIALAQGNTAHNCGCFQAAGAGGSFPLIAWLAGGSTITPFDVVRDLVLILLAAAIYWGDRFTLSLDGVLFRPVVAPEGDTGTDDDVDDDDEVIGVAATPRATPAHGDNVSNRARRKHKQRMTS